MVITLTRPYKAGTLSSIGTGTNGVNTRINTSGITWSSDDIGRHVYFRNGSAVLESREIIAQGTNFCDIRFPFGEFPVTQLDGTEIPSNTPAIGNNLGVSYRFDDIDDGVTLIKVNDLFYRHSTSQAWTINNQVMVHQANVAFEMDSQWIDCNGILQLGNLDEFGNPRDFCNVIETCERDGGFGGVQNQVSSNPNDFGSFRMYGGSMLITSTLFQFLRMIRDSGGGDEIVHVHGVNFDGPAGGRYSGTRSYWFKNVYSRLNTTIGPINPTSSVAMFRDITTNSGTQAAYHFWVASQTLTVPGIRFNPNGITSRFIRMASNARPYVLTFVDILIDDLQALQNRGLNLFVQDGSSVPNPGNDVVLSNILSVSTQNNAADFRLRIKNNSSVEVYDQLADSQGVWSDIFLNWGEVNVRSSGNYDLNDFTVTAPYFCNTRKYDKLTQSFNFDARSSISTIVSDVNDSSITETNKTTVLAYSTLETLDKFRDRQKAEHVDNDDIEDVSAGGGAVDLTNSTDVETSYTGYALIVDSLASAWSHSSGTLTIGASNLASGSNYTNLIPFSTLTFSNGATASCTVTLNNTVVATVDNQAVLAGNVNINNGGQLDLDDITSAQLSGTGSSGGLLKVNGAATSTTLDLRAYTINLGFEVENDSGVDITLRLNATQTVPTLTETNGTITVDNSVLLTLTGLQPNSEVRAYVGTDPNTAIEIAGIENSGNSFNFTHQQNGNEGYLVIHALGFIPRVINLTYQATDQTIPVQQEIDRQYENI